MEALLVAARTLHFAAAIMLTGVVAFERLIAAPAFRSAGADYRAAARLRRRLLGLAWGSLAVLLASGAAWLVAAAWEMGGSPGGVLPSLRLLGVVLTGTRIGEDWLLRLGGAALLGVLLALCHAARQRIEAASSWAALAVAAALLGSLAWAGHGAATAGGAGDLHLAGDLLHLLAAGTWLGTLLPFALLLADTSRPRNAQGPAVTRAASRRYSILALASVTALLAGGLVNTWFLAGTIPALVGTEYGRLLLGKIALFAAMLVVAAVNLLRLTPRVAAASGAATTRTAAQLRRNALIEAALGLGVLAIVGLLGILPPGLHEQPGWPLPFRLDLAALRGGEQILLAIAAALFCGCGIAAVSTTAAGQYRRAAAAAVVLMLCGAAGSRLLAPAVEPAYPTSFYAAARPYSAASVAGGAAIYGENCVACHGAGGHGNGPAAAGLPVRPADLTEEHLFAHTPGDLFWWVSRGRANGAMPGFAAALTPDQRWDVINFVRARAAGDLAREVGADITAAAAYPVPDFAFETGGVQDTLRRTLEQGPVLLVLFAPPAPLARLRQLAEVRPRLAGAGLRVLAVELGQPVAEGASGNDVAPPFVVSVSGAVRTTLALFHAAGSGGETELMLDKNGDVRARWTASGSAGLPDADTLIADAARAARFAVAAPSHAGHAR